MIGQTISHYKILEKLGEGGMGVVYKAEDTKLRRIVALKFLPAHAVGEGEHRVRFEREAQAAASLNHPNICTVYEIDENNGRPFIAMEFVDGETLAAIVENGPLKIDEALDIAIQAARGLAEAHGRGIVHRDIKSANIMVAPERTGQERQVKLMDFGLAQLATAHTQLTKEGSTLGTMAYMAPEQARGEKVDHRADIWALGVVLYELVAGRQPYRADYEQAVLYSILNETHEPLTAVRTGVPKEMERIAEKALAKGTAARYQHAEDMLVDLRELKRQRESGSAIHSAAKAPPGRPMSRWYALGGAAALAAIAAVLWTVRSNTPAGRLAEEPLRPAPFTSYEGSEIQATFSPDGNQVAFAWNGENKEQFDIYAKAIGTGQPLRLTANPADDLAPSWSPDGRWIAFRRLSSDESTVYLIPPLGGNERKLATLSAQTDDQIDWSPDAKLLFLSDREVPGTPRAIFTIDIETGEKRRFSSSAPGSAVNGDFRPAVSAASQNVAFGKATGGAIAGIFTMPIGGSGETQILAPASRVVTGLAWVGGMELLFSDLGGALWRLSLNDPTPRAVAGVAGSVRQPVLSRDSRRLIFETWQTRQDLWRYILPAGGQPVAGVRIASSTQREHSVQISPDGRRVAFVSWRTGRAEIWAADVAGSNATQLTSLAEQAGSQGLCCGSPRWSPDGRTIAFDTIIHGSWDIYTVDADGGSPKPLVVAAGGDSRPSWSHDGKWVYFGSTRSGRNEIWKAPAAGGEPLQVTAKGGNHPMESPNGHFLYFAKDGEQGVFRMPASGGQEERVAPEYRFAGGGYFDPSNDGVYYLDLEGDSYRTSWKLKFFDIASSETRELATLPSPPAGGSTPLDVAPDGTWFAYAQDDESDSDLMLVENFR